METILLVLDGERPQSWNKMYSGRHWSKRSKEAKAVHWLVRAAIPRSAQPFVNAVAITVRAYFNRRPLDADNIVAKLYVDGLCGRLIADDSPKHVRRVTTESRVDRKRPRVEIEIREVGE